MAPTWAGPGLFHFKLVVCNNGKFTEFSKNSCFNLFSTANRNLVYEDASCHSFRLELRNLPKSLFSFLSQAKRSLLLSDFQRKIFFFPLKKGDIDQLFEL